MNWRKFSYPFRKEISQYIQVFSIIFAAISIGKIILDIFTIPYIVLFHNIFWVYQSVFYPPLDYLLSIIFIIYIDPLLRDIILIYVFLGVAVRTTFTQILNYLNIYEFVWASGVKRAGLHFVIFLRALFSSLFWPIFVIIKFRKPYLVKCDTGIGNNPPYLTNEKPPATEWKEAITETFIHEFHFIMDIRIYFLKHLSYIIAAVIFIVLINYAYAIGVSGE